MGALMVYAFASYQLSREVAPLLIRCSELGASLSETKKTVTGLREIVSSLSDPAADEYALITELGRIPENSRKIMFSEPITGGPSNQLEKKCTSGSSSSHLSS